MHIGGCLSMSQLQQAVSQSLLQPIEEENGILVAFLALVIFILLMNQFQVCQKEVSWKISK